MGGNSRRRDHHEFDLDNLVNKSMSRGMREKQGVRYLFIKKFN